MLNPKLFSEIPLLELKGFCKFKFQCKQILQHFCQESTLGQLSNILHSNSLK